MEDALKYISGEQPANKRTECKWLMIRFSDKPARRLWSFRSRKALRSKITKKTAL
jgi:hypothetical protein